MATESVSLAWDEFQTCSSNMQRDLFQDTHFTDVTLACEDSKLVSAHRAVLSSSSDWFRQVLLQLPQQPPPLLYLRAVTSEQLEDLLHFIYRGQVEVAKDKLENFVNMARDLKIRGLMETKQEKEDMKLQVKNKDKLSSPAQKISIAMENQSNLIDEGKALKLLEDTKKDYLTSQDQGFEENVVQQNRISRYGDNNTETLVKGFENKDIAGEILTEYKRDVFKDHPCNKCHFRTQHYRNLLRHQQIHKETLFQCSFCKKKFSNQTKQRRHENTAHAKAVGKGNSSLDNIPYSQPQSTLEVKHEGGKEEENYKSEVDRQYEGNSQEEAVYQDKSNNKETAFHQEEAIKQEDTKLGEGGDATNKTPSIEGFSENKLCKVCGKYFSNSKNMKKHVKSSHDGLKQTCPHCKASFSQTWILQNHINVKHT